VQLAVDGDWRGVRTEEVEITAAGLVRVRGYEVWSTFDGAAGAGPEEDGAPAPDPEGAHEEVPEPVRLRLAVLDSPLLADGDVAPGVYVGVQAAAGSFRGALVQVSRDGGASWTSLATLSQQTVMGEMRETLRDGQASVFERGSGALVRLWRDGDSLSSAGEAAVLDGAGGALVGDEVIQFAGAAQEGGEWRISTLLRGRRGSEWAMSGHGAGERFVLLTRALARVGLDPSDAGRTLDFRAIPSGSGSERAATARITYRARGLAPYAPVHVVGERNGAGDLDIAWTRRTRIGGEADWQDGVTDVPLSEESESWRIEVLDGAGGVVRTTTTGLGSWTYTAAQQVMDFGSAQAAVDVRLAQISAMSGAGFTASATL
jgi:hypothetical protein